MAPLVIGRLHEHPLPPELRLAHATYWTFRNTVHHVGYFLTGWLAALDLLEKKQKYLGTKPDAKVCEGLYLAVREVKRKIRMAEEDEEKVNYLDGRLPPHWREDLEPLGTDWRKPFLETVPWIVVVFEQRYGTRPDGSRQHHYYVKESVGIACGMFVDSLHRTASNKLMRRELRARYLITP